MFSPAVGRAVRSTCGISTPSICTTGRPAAVITLGAGQQTLNRPPHQRRLSSSKASTPPENSNGSSSTQTTAGTTTTRSPTRKLTGRAARRKTASPPLNVPHVPPTDHLQKPDVKISSFFSLHRPISVTSAVPPVSTSATFDSIFQGTAGTSRKGVLDNIQALSSGIESLEAALRGQDAKHEEVLPEEPHVKHLDGIPRLSVDQMLSRFKPFNPPPAPVPFDQATAESEATPNELSPEASREQPTIVAKKAWSATVIVTESTDSSGHRTYTASTTPMTEAELPSAETSEMEEIEIRQPFLDRMRQRDNEHTRYRDDRSGRVQSDMHLISVKRQRRLKMKKHKYKKLMKRTRLLRRKLDRA